ncbi:MAG: hypothetical protein R3E01_32360 [Pirellulaceae bacterium]|nr:hypothetical protein [Planctomycetales bacterium]
MKFTFGRWRRTMARRWQLGTLVMAGTCIATSNALAVDLANITVSGEPNGGNIPVASIMTDQSTVSNTALGTEGFFVDAGSVIGEYPIRIGDSAANDAVGGVLISQIAETGRQIATPLGGVETVYGTAAIVADDSGQSLNTRNVSGGLAIAAHRGGVASTAVNDTYINGGDPINTNMAAAYFPFSQGWMAGTVSSSSISGAGDDITYAAPDVFVGNAGASIELYVSDAPHFEGPKDGYYKVTIPGLEDSRRQGLLLATVADNVGRFATAAPAHDGSGYILGTIDSDAYFTGDPSTTGEADGRLTPASFVFLPIGTPNVTMATIHPGTDSDVHPTPLVKSGGNFTISNNGANGEFRLSIEGQSPSSGVLLVTPGTSGNGPGGNVSDNVVTYYADGNDWVILSQDIEADSAYSGAFTSPLSGSGQASSDPEVYFSFAFFPFDSPATGPGEIPALSSLTNFSKKRVFGWNAQIIENNANNAPGDMEHIVVSKTSDLNIDALYDNRGDVGVAVDNAFLSPSDGIMFATIREGLRDNTATGGLYEYGQIGGVDNDLVGGSYWTIHTNITDPTNGEFNVNYAGAFFGADSGFQMAQSIDIPGGMIDGLTIDGVSDSFTQGALIVGGHGNDDNYTSASPNGTGWDIRLRDNGTGLENNDQVNYIYLPYDTENLVAGRVNLDGTLSGSTDPAGFTLTYEENGVGGPQYRLHIAGKNPDTGMLLLTGTGESGGEENADNSVIYFADGNDFIIQGLDHRATADLTLTTPEQTSFYFAYIDFDAPPTLGGTMTVAGDYNGNGVVDAADYTIWKDSFGSTSDLTADGNDNGVIDAADYTVWKDNFGNSAAAAATTSTVPEPGPFVLLVGALALVIRRGKSRLGNV